MSQRKHINIDGKFGKQTSRELQQYLVSKGYQVDVDGIFGKGSITALQQHIGVDSDGIWGYNTTKCLQKFLNETSNSIQIKVDGKRGSETYSALQTFLNEYEYEQNKDNTDEKKVEEEYSTLKKDTKTYTKTCKETEIQVNVKDIARLIENSIKISAGGVSLIGNIGQQIQDTVIKIDLQMSDARYSKNNYNNNNIQQRKSSWTRSDFTHFIEQDKQ
eukprot:237475_1